MSRLVPIAMAAAMAAGAGFSSPATAQTQAPQTSETQNCAPRDELVNYLDSYHNESQQAVGLAGENLIIELFVSDQNSWTILVTTTDGVSCLIGAGTEWQSRYVFAERSGMGSKTPPRQLEPAGAAAAARFAPFRH